MFTLIEPRHRAWHSNICHDFDDVRYDDGSGYSFPVDSSGKLIQTEWVDDKQFEINKRQYEYCMNHPEEYEDMGVKDRGWYYTENARGKCTCGNEMELWDQYQGACECPKCGRWYNLFGQRLMNPACWDEDY